MNVYASTFYSVRKRLHKHLGSEVRRSKYSMFKECTSGLFESSFGVVQKLFEHYLGHKSPTSWCLSARKVNTWPPKFKCKVKFLLVFRPNSFELSRKIYGRYFFVFLILSTVSCLRWNTNSVIKTTGQRR